MDLRVRDENEYRRAAVVPKLRVQSVDEFSRDPLHLLEVDERRIVSTQHAVQLQGPECPPKQMGLGRRQRQIVFANEQARRQTRLETEVRPPVPRSRGRHCVMTPYRFATAALFGVGRGHSPGRIGPLSRIRRPAMVGSLGVRRLFPRR